MNYFKHRLESVALLLLKKLDTQVDFTEEDLDEVEREYVLFDGFLPDSGKYRLTALTKKQKEGLDEITS